MESDQSAMKIKYIAIFLLILVIVAMAGVSWLYMTARVTVEATGVTAYEASSQPELFALLSEQVRNNAITGTAFSTSLLDDITQYQFYTYTVRLRNDCLLDAESVEIQVTPMTGDMMQLADLTPATLDARSTRDMQATILTDVQMHGVREVNITYYMWGIPFTLRTTCGN